MRQETIDIGGMSSSRVMYYSRAGTVPLLVVVGSYATQQEELCLGRKIHQTQTCDCVPCLGRVCHSTFWGQHCQSDGPCLSTLFIRDVET